MPKITLTLPDGSKKELDKGVTGLEVAQSIGSRLAEAAVAIKVDNELYDLDRQINSNAKIRILTFDDPEGRDVFHHSSAHLLANAVLSVRPKTSLTVGPTTEV
jgi:threonyl-tRNA synthetase